MERVFCKHLLFGSNGTLSSKIGAPKLLKALDIIPDDSMDLSPLIEAYMPGAFFSLLCT